MSTNSTANTNKKHLDQVFALWKRKSKDGKSIYFTGKLGEQNITAFYNLNKKNLKEPDMKVYTRDENGNLSKDPVVSLWCNATKRGKKILSGKIDGKRVVGFINANATEKQPYILVYWSDESQATAPKKEEKKDEKPSFEEITANEELPF